MNEHSPKFYLVQEYYNSGKWNKNAVYNAVGRWITEEEYEEIVGSPYIPKN